MAEYNPSKIIKDGNTYNFRDTTKIPLAGSNAISGDLIPSTDGTVNLGGSSYQWNNAYIKSLTINGVACGNILTHNVSEFVGVTGNQTIGGVKTFSTNSCKFYKQIVINHDLSYSKHNPPSQGAYHNLMFTDASGWWGAYIENVTDNSGNSTLAFYVRNTNEASSRVCLRCGIDGSFSMYPFSHNTWNLGTSTNKWKSFNGIAPDELGLPTSTYTDVSSYITNFDGTANIFTAPVSGLLYIDGGVSNSVDCAILNNTKGCGINVANSFGTIRGLFPVEKDDSISVYISESITIGAVKIYHLKGKV